MCLKMRILLLCLVCALLFTSSATCIAKELPPLPMVYFDNATTGYTESNRANESIENAVIYWSFYANCDSSAISNCDLFDPVKVWNQALGYNVSFNYYILGKDTYRYVPDKDISWSSRKFNNNSTAIRLGYLNQTWAQEMANETGENISKYNQPTNDEYRSLALLLATMKLEWEYGLKRIMFYNKINPNFPDPNINLKVLDRKLKDYGLSVDLNGTLTVAG